MSNGIVLESMVRESEAAVAIGESFPVTLSILEGIHPEPQVVTFRARMAGYTVTPPSVRLPPGKHVVALTLLGPARYCVVCINGEAVNHRSISVQVKARET